MFKIDDLPHRYVLTASGWGHRLRAAGIPVEVKRGASGGYRLGMLPRVPPLTFGPGEVAALVASLVALGPYTSATAQSALAKLVTAFSAEHGTPDKS
jgi:predicted DNA-binding transcriptional regulator YafY